MYEKILETVNFLKQKIDEFPTYGIILGSGLGALVNEIKISHTIFYKDIPNFPVSTVKGHKGSLVFGKIGDKNVVVMQGRFHFYEGYDMKTLTFPVRVMKYLGVQTLIVSNASGGVNPSYEVGDVVIITDHINFFPEHPLRGQNDDRLGPRFLNMSEPYCKSLNQLAMTIADEFNLNVKKGIYLGLQGPTFETLAEYLMVKHVGADCVGMSTVPEVIVAKHGGMNCFGISVISDMGNEESIGEINHHEVLVAVKKATPAMRLLVKELILRH